MVARVSTDELEIQLLNIWLFGRRHGDIGTETHNILHTIKTGSDWPVMAVMHSSRMLSSQGSGIAGLTSAPFGSLKKERSYSRTSAGRNTRSMRRASSSDRDFRNPSTQSVA